MLSSLVYQFPVNCLCTWFRFDQDAAGVRFGAQSLQEQALEGDEAGGAFGHGTVPRQECHANIPSSDIPDTMPCVTGTKCISNPCHYADNLGKDVSRDPGTAVNFLNCSPVAEPWQTQRATWRPGVQSENSSP